MGVDIGVGTSIPQLGLDQQRAQETRRRMQEAAAAARQTLPPGATLGPPTHHGPQGFSFPVVGHDGNPNNPSSAFPMGTVSVDATNHATYTPLPHDETDTGYAGDSSFDAGATGEVPGSGSSAAPPEGVSPTAAYAAAGGVEVTSAYPQDFQAGAPGYGYEASNLSSMPQNAGIEQFPYLAPFASSNPDGAWSVHTNGDAVFYRYTAPSGDYRETSVMARPPPWDALPAAPAPADGAAPADAAAPALTSEQALEAAKTVVLPDGVEYGEPTSTGAGWAVPALLEDGTELGFISVEGDGTDARLHVQNGEALQTLVGGMLPAGVSIAEGVPTSYDPESGTYAFDAAWENGADFGVVVLQPDGQMHVELHDPAPITEQLAGQLPDGAVLQGFIALGSDPALYRIPVTVGGQPAGEVRFDANGKPVYAP